MRHLGPGLRGGPRILWSLPCWLLSLGLGALVGLGSTPVRAEPQGASVAPAHPPLTPVAFAGLLMRLQRKSFGDEQLDLVRDVTQRGSSFTCEQARQLVQATATGGQQVAIAATLYPHVVDPEHLSQLVAALPREDEQRTLRRLIERETHPLQVTSPASPNIY